MTHPLEKPLRADALRNRTRILAAARREITDHGPEVGMDEIAAAATVAVGTVYRHFPTKAHLVAAVVSEYLTQVADRTELAASRIEQGSPAFVELDALFRDIVRATATNQAAKAAASGLGQDVGDSGDSADLHRTGVALQKIVDAARAQGAVRDDLSIDDLYLLVSNIPPGQPAAILDRWVELTLHGIVGPAPR